MRSRISVGLVLLTFLTAFFVIASESHAMPLTPLGPHCIGKGPISLPVNDPDFCGCTWGAVYYRGQPLPYIPITLQFQTQSIVALNEAGNDVENFPYYAVSGASMGAKLNDMMTLVVPLATTNITRTFRARPDENKEQEIHVVLPEQGIWSHGLTSGYTRTLLIQGNTLWAGGPAGLLQVDLTSNVSQTHSLPWPTANVVALAVAPNNHVWAAGPQHLAEWDGANWQNRSAPFSAPIRALAVDPSTGALWAGGGENTAALAVYDGTWRQVTAVDELITALAIDSVTNLWVGTWGGGAYRHAGNVSDPNNGWTHYRLAEGLASDYIYTLAAQDQTLWFGTRPYNQNQRNLGGISRYQATSNTWQTYTTTHGLPADALLPASPAPILAMAVDGNGSVWAGTGEGIYRLVTPTLWLPDLSRSGDGVRALGAAGQQLVAGWARGQISQLNQALTPGQPPTVQISQTQAITLNQAATLQLTASATDQDNDARESNPQILAWDWRSDRDGPLCTTAGVCELPASTLSLGAHTLSLRVQDDEGVWSQTATTRLVVTQVQNVYLAVVQRN